MHLIDTNYDLKENPKRKTIYFLLKYYRLRLYQFSIIESQSRSTCHLLVIQNNKTKDVIFSDGPSQFFRNQDTCITVLQNMIEINL